MEIRSFRYSSRRPVRRKTLFKRLLPAILASILIFSSAGYVYAALHKTLPAISVSIDPLKGVPSEQVSLPWPSNGQAAIGGKDEGILAESLVAASPRPIASTAKIITALAVMKQKPFLPGSQGATITLDATDVGFYDSYVAKNGSVARVAAGEQLTQYQALQALLLPSANNMADSLARWAFGSIEGYLAYANNMAKDVGLAHTVVADASGFSPATVSTATDLVTLARLLLDDPILSQIVAQKEATLPVAGLITNTNQLLLAGKAIGIKTGHTDEAGWCLVFARVVTGPAGQKTTIAGSILAAPNSANLYANAENLLAAATSGLSTREVIRREQVVGKYTSKWGKSGLIVAAQPLAIYGWKGTELKPQLTAPATISTSVQKGQEIGTVTVNSTKVQLSAQTEIAPPSVWWKLTHFFGS